MNRQFEAIHFNSLVILYVMELSLRKDEMLLTGRIEQDVYDYLTYISSRNFSSMALKVGSSDDKVHRSLDELKEGITTTNGYRLIV